MKRSPFAVISLIAGILVAIPAVLIAIIDGLGLSEGSILVTIAFPIVAILSFPEAPAQLLPFQVITPVILPLIAIVCGVIGMKNGGSSARMSIWGIILAVLSVAVHLIVRWMYA